MSNGESVFVHGGRGSKGGKRGIDGVPGLSAVSYAFRSVISIRTHSTDAPSVPRDSEVNSGSGWASSSMDGGRRRDAKRRG